MCRPLPYLSALLESQDDASYRRLYPTAPVIYRFESTRRMGSLLALERKYR